MKMPAGAAKIRRGLPEKQPKRSRRGHARPQGELATQFAGQLEQLLGAARRDFAVRAALHSSLARILPRRKTCSLRAGTTPPVRMYDSSWESYRCTTPPGHRKSGERESFR